MKAFEQRKYFNAVISYVTKQFFLSEIISKDDNAVGQSPTVSGTAYLLNCMMENNDVLKGHVVSSLTKSAIPSLDESLAARRAIIAALVRDEGAYWSLFSSQALILCRQITKFIRELHQDLWGLSIRQTHTYHAARKSVYTLHWQNRI